jgi:hypothetical protein
MKRTGFGAAENLPELSQEATNQSTPDKALEEQARRVPRRKVAPKRTKAPDA